MPSLAFIALLSGLGHKEWRFIIYTIPIFNVAAARSASLLIDSSRKRIWRSMATIFVSAILILNLLFTVAATYVSMLNYPGGEALHTLHVLPPLNAAGDLSVHIDNNAAQTGASLFLQSSSPPFTRCTLDKSGGPQKWTYDKLADIESVKSNFTHVLVEDASSYLHPEMIESLSLGHISLVRPGNLVHQVDNARKIGSWIPLAIVYGFDGWERNNENPNFLFRYVPIPSVAPKLWILQQAQ